MSSTLNGSSAIWHFKHGNAVKLMQLKLMMFDFYPGLLQLYFALPDASRSLGAKQSARLLSGVQT